MVKSTRMVSYWYLIQDLSNGKGQGSTNRATTVRLYFLGQQNGRTTFKDNTRRKPEEQLNNT